MKDYTMINEIYEHIKNGCHFGQPSGPDDFDECCECPEEE